MKRVLFLCTGNSCRSQMAEGWLRHLAGDQFDALSAGTHPQGLNPMAVVSMQERGIDISSHQSKSVNEFAKQHIDYVISVCDQAREHCPIFSNTGTTLHWSFPDPAQAKGTEEEQNTVFHEVRDAIEERIREFLRDVS